MAAAADLGDLAVSDLVWFVAASFTGALVGVVLYDLMVR